MEEKLRYLEIYPDVSLDSLETQVKLESEAFQYGLERYQRNMAKRDLSDTTAGYALIQKNYGRYLKALYQYIYGESKGPVDRHADIKPFLRRMKLENLTYVAMRTILNLALVRMHWRSLAAFAHRIVLSVKEQYALEVFHQMEPKLLANIESNQMHKGVAHRRNVLFAAGRHHGIPMQMDLDYMQEIKLGLELLYILVESTGLVWTKAVYNGHKKEIYFSFHEDVLKWILDINRDLAEEEPFEMPMIIPPVPWTDLYDGGFITNLIRKSNPLIKISYEKKLETYPPLPEVCNAVNKLQSVPWRINKELLEVIKECSNGGHYIDVAIPSNEDLPLPHKSWGEADPVGKEELRIWKKQARDVHEANTQQKQDRVVLRRKLFIADKFKDYPEIYFCWTLDWRGRAYPVQSFINPQGDDVSKSLIQFAKGKQVTPEGLYWLKVHCANCYGIDKVSFEDRVKWVDEHKKEITEVGKLKLDSGSFWREAGDPFQFMAVCIDLAGYWDNPKDHLSHTAVFMDGSCNGLQHLSAMLRDGIGGQSVNLLPTEKPSDVYSDVLKHVVSKVETDAKNGNPSAKLWLGKVDRKMVKRGVMTTPYGVTSYGLQDQIEQEMLKRSKNYLNDPKESRAKHASYLGRCLREGMEKALVKACEVMDYLRYLAGEMTDGGLDIQWLAPNGFYVQQDYVKFTHEAKCIKVFGKTMVLNVRRGEASLNKMRQVQGIVPNFVHSYDAAHMMKTILAMPEGVSLGMIHDSYGSHCSDIPLLHRVLREEFVKIYKENPLEKLWKVCSTRLGRQLREPPKAGDLDISKVMESKYFFS